MTTCKDDVGECAMRAYEASKAIFEDVPKSKKMNDLGMLNEVLLYLGRQMRAEGHAPKEWQK